MRTVNYFCRLFHTVNIFADCLLYSVDRNVDWSICPITWAALQTILYTSIQYSIILYTIYNFIYLYTCVRVRQQDQIIVILDTIRFFRVATVKN